jgi:alpha-tubulin suppressor-like RCC1 family protein
MLQCFGSDESGSIGDGFTGHAEPRGVTGIADATAVVVGDEFSCAAVATGVRCWGANDFGQLGNGEIARTATRRTVPGLGGAATSIAVGANHSCASVGTQVLCWGRNHEGQVSPGTAEFAVAAPVEAFTLSGTMPTLVASWQHTCVLDNQAGTCWGTGDAIGQTSPGRGPSFSTGLLAAADYATCGQPTLTPSDTFCIGVAPWDASKTGPTPLPIGPAHSFISLAAGTGILAGVDGLNAAYAGASCGDSSPGGTSPVNLGMVGSVTPMLVAAAQYANLDSPMATGHVCIVDAASPNLYCFGPNDAGQLATTDTTCAPPTAPALIPAPADSSMWGSNPGMLSLASRHSCAIATDNALYCWGANEFGELGGLPAKTTTPTPLDANRDWAQIATARHHSCGITMDGTVYCWGVNKWGELGAGPHFHDTPVDVMLP